MEGNGIDTCAWIVHVRMGLDKSTKMSKKFDNSLLRQIASKVVQLAFRSRFRGSIRAVVFQQMQRN